MFGLDFCISRVTVVQYVKYLNRKSRFWISASSDLNYKMSCFSKCTTVIFTSLLSWKPVISFVTNVEIGNHVCSQHNIDIFTFHCIHESLSQALCCTQNKNEWIYVPVPVRVRSRALHVVELVVLSQLWSFSYILRKYE